MKKFLLLFAIAFLLVERVEFLRLYAQTASEKPLPVIFDTDMDTDCDDMGAMAVLHALADLGEIEILGTLVSSHYAWSAPCVAAVNQYYGRPSIPIGVPKGPGASVHRGSRYARQIAEQFPTSLKTNADAPDAVQVYRRLLHAADDGSVVLVTVGYLTNLSDLLASSGDSISSLTGRELIARKIKRYVCMGGRYPEMLNHGEWGNFMPDPKAVLRVVNEWPLPIWFSGDGEKVLTGSTLEKTPEANPVRVAYRLYLGQIKTRPSWDQITLLYAVRPEAPCWQLTDKGYNHIFENGTNQWRSEPDKDHLLVQVVDAQLKNVTQVIEELMTALPRNGVQ